MLVKGVGDVGVGEGESVGVLPQRGSRISVTESGLGGEDVTPGDEEGGDVVPKLVEGGFNAGGVAEPFEAVTQDSNGQVALMLEVGAEHPRPEVPSGQLAPLGFEGVPETSGGGSEGERPGPPRFGCGDHVTGNAAGDGQHPLVEISKTKGGELASAGPRVGGEADQEQVLFCTVTPEQARWVAVVIGERFEDSGLGGAEEGGEVLVSDRAPGFHPGGASHTAEGVVVDDAYVISPPDSGAQHPEPTGDHRWARTLCLPTLECVPYQAGCQIGHLPIGEELVGAQVAGVSRSE